LKLIDRLKTGDFNYWFKAEPLLQEYLDALNDPELVVIDVSNVSDYMALNSDRFKESIRDVISCALPPFPVCWMECRVAQKGFLPSALVQIGGLIKTLDMRGFSSAEKTEVAARIRMPEDRRYDLEKALWLVSSEFSSLTDDGALGCLQSYAYFLLDENGAILRPMMADSFVDDALFDVETRQAMSHVTLEMMSVFGMAAAFMSCKNVAMVPKEPDPKLAKARQRRNKPPLTKYYTLEIEPMKQVLRTEGKSEEVGLKKALHICRGHFANYSEDKPLFGKVSGRFWIPAHVRGSGDAGEIKKDYKIVVPKNE
jgi:hypothetical protein